MCSRRRRVTMQPRHSFRILALITVLAAGPAAIAQNPAPAKPGPAAPKQAAAAPAADAEALKFAVIGDSGTGGSAQQRVAERLISSRTTFPYEFILMLGDNLYG